MLFAAGYMILFLSSCLNSDNDYSYTTVTDAQIGQMTLSSDSIPGLSDVNFVIDQVEGRIFNRDSMPYGTEIKGKVAVNFTAVTALTSIEMINIELKDTVKWESTTDSIDFSGQIKITSVAANGSTSKIYMAQINVHQVIPDTLIWNQALRDQFNLPVREQKVVPLRGNYLMYSQLGSNIQNQYDLRIAVAGDPANWQVATLSGLPASGMNLIQLAVYEDAVYMASTAGDLYRSDDGRVWAPLQTGMQIVSILGTIEKDERSESALALIVFENGVYYYANMDKDFRFSRGEAVRDGFPLSGFGSLSYSSMYNGYLLLAGGRDKDNNLLESSWTTDNGLNWAEMTSTKTFGEKEGVALTIYDDKFYLIGGLDEDGKGTNEIYTSVDKGITWDLLEVEVVLPNNHRPRGYSSVIVDVNKYMFLFGGRETESSNVSDQIWVGRLNRLSFVD